MNNGYGWESRIEWMAAKADEIYQSQRDSTVEDWPTSTEYAVAIIDAWLEQEPELPFWFDTGCDRDWMIGRLSGE